VQRLFSSFPSGLAGVALILLRLCTTLALVCDVFLRHAPPFSPLLYVLAGAVALAVLVGVMLPLSCAAAIVLQLFVASWPLTAPVVISVLHAIALACLGAGAYSVDAIFYGRRVIILPKNDK
jgi:hypothetical protein